MMNTSRFARGVSLLTVTIVALGCLYAALARIEPLLPPERGSACFTGKFAGELRLVRGRPHQERADEEPVVALQLRLDRRGDQEPHWDRAVGWGWDWQYDLTLEVTTATRNYRGNGTQCNWSSNLLSHIVPDLGCYIDCDGGGISIRRVPGRAAMDVVWDIKSWLRMSSCGGGGEILRAGSSSKRFRIEKTACANAL